MNGSLPDPVELIRRQLIERYGQVRSTDRVEGVELLEFAAGGHALFVTCGIYTSNCELLMRVREEHRKAPWVKRLFNVAVTQAMRLKDVSASLLVVPLPEPIGTVAALIGLSEQGVAELELAGLPLPLITLMGVTAPDISPYFSEDDAECAAEHAEMLRALRTDWVLDPSAVPVRGAPRPGRDALDVPEAPVGPGIPLVRCPRCLLDQPDLSRPPDAHGALWVEGLLLPLGPLKSQAPGETWTVTLILKPWRPDGGALREDKDLAIVLDPGVQRCRNCSTDLTNAASVLFSRVGMLRGSELVRVRCVVEGDSSATRVSARFVELGSRPATDPELEAVRAERQREKVIKSKLLGELRWDARLSFYEGTRVLPGSYRVWVEAEDEDDAALPAAQVKQIEKLLVAMESRYGSLLAQVSAELTPLYNEDWLDEQIGRMTEATMAQQLRLSTVRVAPDSLEHLQLSFDQDGVFTDHLVAATVNAETWKVEDVHLEG